MDIETFLSSGKSMVVAPAGYGKTYTIAEAIAAYKGDKKVLVLTHTHAGIASLKEKFNQKGLLETAYHLDTICSFALALTKTYHIRKEDIPSESEPNTMFRYAVEHARLILRAKPIKKLLASEYDHLIVDEYQDCTELQHQMIMQIATTLKTHILGDELQGIFGFRDPIVDFTEESLKPYLENCQTLDTPWRWHNVGKDDLGRDIAAIRGKLLKNEDVDLRDYPSIEVLIAPESNYTQPRSEYKMKLYDVLRNESALLIHPKSESPAFRVNYVKQFPQLRMIESIDDKDLYEYCDRLDRLSSQNLVFAVVEMMRKLSKSTVIDIWFKKDNLLKAKQDVKDQVISDTLMGVIEPLLKQKSYANIVRLIENIQKLPDLKVYRKELLLDICKALKDAERLGITARQAVERNRNILRQKGRKIKGRGIGTTLLTKGLEFDTVAVLNAHQFKSPKHLYVAISRCSRRLVVITQSYVLHPYQ